MKFKSIFQLLFLFFINISIAQDYLSFKSGKNFTKFNYVDKQGNDASHLFQTDIGNWYSLGYNCGLYEDRYERSFFNYEGAISLGDYNSVVGLKSANYQWKTVYVGIDNSLILSLMDTENFVISTRLGFNVAKIVFGKESINGEVYDIKAADGFRGITFQGVIGIQAKLFSSNAMSYSLGYDYLQSLNASVQGAEKLSLGTQRVWIGINLDINN